MLLHGDLYKRELKESLKEAEEASVAIAFWGRGSESLFEGWRGKSLRVICNLDAGGTNPLAIRALQQIPGIEVKQLTGLHAKLLVTDKRIIVGSANASTNGLGLNDDESAGWHEVGVASIDEKMRTDAKNWFEDQWRQSKDISATDLDHAAELWASRQKIPRAISADLGLLERRANELENRPYYILIYRDNPSTEESDRIDGIQTKIANNSELPININSLDFYTRWGDEESRSILNNPHAFLVPIYFGKRGRIRIHGIQRPIPEFHTTFVNSDGELINIDCTVCLKTNEHPKGFNGFNGNPQEIENLLKQWLQDLALPSDDIGRIVPMSKFLSWREKKRQMG